MKDIISRIQSFHDRTPQGVVVIWGATATGKSGLSLEVARQQSSQIISADSRQIYRYMDIGTDKVSKEVRDEIVHHQIDIVDPDQTYTAGEWKDDVRAIIPQIHTAGDLAMIVGGTGLYINTIYKNFSMPEVAPDEIWRAEMMKREEESPGYLYQLLSQKDPVEVSKHHPNSTRYLLRALEICEKTGKTKTELAKQLPVERPLLMVGLRREKEDTNKRINARIKEMIAGGLVDEVQGLLDRGYTLDHTAMNGIGYKEVVGYIDGEYGKDKMIELLKRNSHRYAKRQRSWFRKYIAEGQQMPKEGVEYEVIAMND